MPARRRSYRRRGKQNGSGCFLLAIPLIIIQLLTLLGLILKAFISLANLLGQFATTIYKYFKENPIALRNTLIGSGVIVTLLIGFNLCMSTVNFVSGLIPTTAPTVTLTSTLTTTPTITLSPTITLTSTITLTPTITFTPTITSTPTITLTPSPSSTSTPGAPTSGFILIYVDETASIGGVAEAKIRTQPNSQCKLVFVLPSGRESTVDGVGEQIADKDGYCSWWWEIKGNVKSGKGAIVITAGGKTEIYGIKIE